MERNNCCATFVMWIRIMKIPNCYQYFYSLEKNIVIATACTKSYCMQVHKIEVSVSDVHKKA